MIRVPQAPDTYSRESEQQLRNAVTELQKQVMALSAYPIPDITTGENKKIVLDNGTLKAVDP